ncbi:protein of unknown function [Ruminococcaceae bacterium BL-6]|nr:protein of unknown function [Ruminococcaceae bacterium BL-6]
MKKKTWKRLAEWLDVIFLLPGMAFLVYGTFQIYIPAGFILCGCCLIALSVIFGKIRGGDGS